MDTILMILILIKIEIEFSAMTSILLKKNIGVFKMHIRIHTKDFGDTSLKL